MHEPKAQKRFFLPFFLIVPDPVNHLDLVQIASGKNIITEILIPDDHVEKNLTLGTYEEVKMSLIFISFRQKLIDMKVSNVPIPKGCPDLLLQSGIINLKRSFVRTC